MEHTSPIRRRKPPRSVTDIAAENERDAACPPEFEPARPRPRFDGWTPNRQVEFIQALAESGCVVEACRAVGMSQRSAYALRGRADAVSFRNAWDAALDYAMRRLADAVLSRAINGVAVPVFYQGEQVGEKRYFDERLAMFLLRRRSPVQYGEWIDRARHGGHPEGDVLALSRAKIAVREDADLGIDEIGDRVSLRLDELAEAMRMAERMELLVRPSMEGDEEEGESRSEDPPEGKNEGDVS